MLIAKEMPRSQLPILEGGAYLARCVGAMDMGDQYDAFHKKTKRDIMLTFELTDEYVERESVQENRWISRSFTLSLSEKSSLRKALSDWFGRDLTEDERRGFDVTELIGRGCLLQITKKERADGGFRNQISTIGALPKGMQAGKPTGPTFVFDMDNETTWHVLDDLPAHMQWLATQARESTTWQALHEGAEEMGMDEEPEVDMETGEIKRGGAAKGKGGLPF
jgi:hypothetical protein